MVTIPVSCGRGETSLKMTSSPLMKSSTPKIPRPHDTGMVTLISQDLSEFALHARAILGLPIPNIRTRGPAASAVVLVHGESDRVRFLGLENALAEPDTQLRLFGKPKVSGKRRMGVALARDKSLERAKEKASRAAEAVEVNL